MLTTTDTQEVWNDSDYDESISEDEPEIPLSLENDSEISSSEKSLINRLVIFLLAIQARFYLTDTVMDILFRFLKAFFTVLGRIHTDLIAIGKLLPSSLYKARKKRKMLESM